MYANTLATASRRRFWHRFRRSLWTTVLHRAETARSRRQLAQLDDHLLRDIGLTRDQAEAEAALSAWDAPPHWHRGES
jgi:uncharacterized protein YjiS (DUF1127 family)